MPRHFCPKTRSIFARESEPTGGNDAGLPPAATPRGHLSPREGVTALTGNAEGATRAWRVKDRSGVPVSTCNPRRRQADRTGEQLSRPGETMAEACRQREPIAGQPRAQSKRTTPPAKWSSPKAFPSRGRGAGRQNDDVTAIMALYWGCCSQPMQRVSKASDPSVRFSRRFSSVSPSFSPRLSLPPLYTPAV